MPIIIHTTPFYNMSWYYLTVFLIKIGSFYISDQAKDYLLIKMVVYQYLIKKLIYLAYKTKLDIVLL